MSSTPSGTSASPALSTTITLAPRTESRQRASAGPEWYATTTTEIEPAELDSRLSGAEPLEVRVDHPLDQLLERRLRLPAEPLLGLARVADQLVDLGRPH